MKRSTALLRRRGGMRALLAAVAMMFQRKGLRAGDRLTVRPPIEGLDIPGG